MRRLISIAVTAAALSCGGAYSSASMISGSDAGATEGTADAGGEAPDAGTPTAVNGCTPGNSVDAMAPGASRTVPFTFFKYSPACLIIAAGQSVTFSGDFFSHPLRGGVAPSVHGGAGSSQSPIASVNGGTSASFTFTQAGTYPYYCSAHESVGMYGAILVR